jgi:hypothetical protein
MLLRPLGRRSLVGLMITGLTSTALSSAYSTTKPGLRMPFGPPLLAVRMSPPARERIRAGRTGYPPSSCPPSRCLPFRRLLDEGVRRHVQHVAQGDYGRPRRRDEV